MGCLSVFVENLKRGVFKSIWVSKHEISWSRPGISDPPPTRFAPGGAQHVHPLARAPRASPRPGDHPVVRKAAAADMRRRQSPSPDLAHQEKPTAGDACGVHEVRNCDRPCCRSLHPPPLCARVRVRVFVCACVRMHLMRFAHMFACPPAHSSRARRCRVPLFSAQHTQRGTHASAAAASSSEFCMRQRRAEFAVRTLCSSGSQVAPLA